MTRVVLKGLALGILTLISVAPAHAVTILQFTEHEDVLTGLDHKDIAGIEAANETELGFAIDYLGKVDGFTAAGTTWVPNTALNPGFALLNPIFNCTSGGTDQDCQGNFTVDIDFSVLANPNWQLVKIVVKAGQGLEDWLTPLVPHVPQQQGVVSPRDAGQGGGVSHLLLFGTTTAQVPEPTSVIVLGLGLAIVGVAIWRRQRKPS